MSDNMWRRKSYYRPRVLVDVRDFEDTPLTDALVCLSARELLIVRNMLAYAHRRSTWVSEYHEGYYLAPTNEEWDAIEAALAELEDKLMGCSEILDALQCICAAVRGLELNVDIPQSMLDTGETVFDGYQSPVVEDEGDPPGGWESWDDWRVQKCKAAQKYIDEMLSSMESLSSVMMIGTGVTAILVYAQLVYSAAAFFPPLAIVMTIAAGIALYGLSALQTEARAWVTAHKQDMVCLLFNASNAGSAYLELQDYIDAEWDVQGSAFFVQNFVNFVSLSKIFDGNVPGYDDWQADYSASYCVNCDPDFSKYYWGMTQDGYYSTDGGSSWDFWDYLTTPFTTIPAMFGEAIGWQSVNVDNINVYLFDADGNAVGEYPVTADFVATAGNSCHYTGYDQDNNIVYPRTAKAAADPPWSHNDFNHAVWDGNIAFSYQQYPAMYAELTIEDV